jgi:hypothetical protein
MSHTPDLRPPPVSALGLPWFFRLCAAVERAFTWVLAYPLLSLQMLFFLLIAWAGLGRGLGLDNAFWNENPLVQGLVGLAVGILFGEILLVRYLLDPSRDRLGAGPSLFPAATPPVRQLGEYLLLFWPASLLLLYVPRLLTDLPAWLLTSPENTSMGWLDRREVAAWFGVPLALGLVLSVALGWLVVRAAGKWGLTRRLQDSILIRLSPGVWFNAIPKDDYPLHALALLLGLVFFAGVGLVYALYYAGAPLAPMVVLAVVLTGVNALYGFIAFHFRGLQHLLIALLLVTGVAFDGFLFKQSLPGLDEEYARARAGAPLRLDEEAKKDGHRVDHYEELLIAQRNDPATGPALIDSVSLLEGMRARWQGAHPDAPQSRPRLVLVAASGGGIRAAVWTAIVLEGLEREIPTVPGKQAGLRDHIRVITGASGGMVGAGLYVAKFRNGALPQTYDPVTRLGPLSAVLAQDSLSRTVDTMLLEDFPHLWWPGPVAWDRGREIERVWCDYAPELKTTFGALEASERAGDVPSLVYSPMLVEDSRRLFISNLDLADLTHRWAPKLSVHPGFTEPISPEGPALSLSAVELARLFPQKARALPLSTAARLNASFPWVSPGVSLPTNPPRRVVDAGYFDNDGVDVAALWLHRYWREVKENTSGVVLIQVRASRSDYARRKFQDREAEKLNPSGAGGQGPPMPRPSKGLFVRGMQWLSTPGEAILTEWERSMWYRNDELLHLLNPVFNSSQDPEFFVSVAFECSVDADLSWTLPRREATEIAQGFYQDAAAGTMPAWTDRRVKRLREWFGSGGR